MSKIFCDCSDLQVLSRELPSQPRNHGVIWSQHLKNELADDFRALHNLRSLCIKYGRTPDSIVAKLRDMNLLEYYAEDGAYRYKTLEKQTPTQPETKLEKDMTQPLQTLTLLFGTDIKECTPDKLIKVIQQCQAEFATHNALPINAYSTKRMDELKAAIAAAVDELNTRA
jgi:hypothetical protein